MILILDPTEHATALAGQKVIVCDYPDGRLEIMHESFTLAYRTFDTLRSVHRSPVVENKRLDGMLSLVAEIQQDRHLQRSKRGPRRTGQTNSRFEIADGSQSNGYLKCGRKPGRLTDFMNDPKVIARRQKAPARMEAVEQGRFWPILLKNSGA